MTLYNKLGENASPNLPKLNISQNEHETPEVLPYKPKVLLAMSGGVDSTAALLLLKDDYDVTGVTLKLFDSASAGSAAHDKACCTADDAQLAAVAAAKYGIRHYVYNYTDLFSSQVIERFKQGYRSGNTPNPCVDCNRYIKFGALWERAKSLGFDYIATGHYGVIDRSGARPVLKKPPPGKDEKDQSYVLYCLDEELLRHTLLPLSGLTKEEVRALAREAGFDNADKPESQDICFVPDGDYAGFLERSGAVSPSPGFFIGSGGEVIGRHEGHYRFTVGQRRGLALPLGYRAFVIGKSAEKNEVYVGAESDLFTTCFTVNDIVWTSADAITQPLRLNVKLRYRAAEVPCAAAPNGRNSVSVTLDSPAKGISPGQSAVFYHDDIVMFGGIICQN